jgi:hypothetical protein
LQCQ